MRVLLTSIQHAGLMMAWFVLVDIMKSKSTPDFLKKERMPLTKQLRGVRSKVGVDEYKQYQNINLFILPPNNSRKHTIIFSIYIL